MILHEIFRVVSRFPGYISCYIAENQLPVDSWFVELLLESLGPAPHPSAALLQVLTLPLHHQVELKWGHSLKY